MDKWHGIWYGFRPSCGRFVMMWNDMEVPRESMSHFDRVYFHVVSELLTWNCDVEFCFLGRVEEFRDLVGVSRREWVFLYVWVGGGEKGVRVDFDGCESTFRISAQTSAQSEHFKDPQEISRMNMK